jgi:hypothetical protein
MGSISVGNFEGLAFCNIDLVFLSGLKADFMLKPVQKAIRTVLPDLQFIYRICTWFSTSGLDKKAG